jgi:hypothetical protein
LSASSPAQTSRRIIQPARCLIGAALAWPLASIPIYYWRRQIMLEEQRIRTLAGGHMVAPCKHSFMSVIYIVMQLPRA